MLKPVIIVNLNIKDIVMLTIKDLTTIETINEVDFPYRNKEDLLNAVDKKIREVESVVKDYIELKDSEDLSNPQFWRKLGFLVFELDFNFDRDFGDSLTYVVAREGLPEYQTYMADYYLDERYGRKDYKEGLFWLEKAAKNPLHSDPIYPKFSDAREACEKIAKIYEEGVGVAKDPEAAKSWRLEAERLRSL